MKSLARTRTIGGSLVVTIPKEVVRGESLTENQLVEIEVGKIKKDFFGALKGVGPFTEQDRLKGQLEE
ncbi:hypothetical protein CMI37_07825 [Candidatus Pacearchaeota archaeon]|nr:hypothetical protein [Candidatus Pacearchaeota archaeon]|tara:strand:+ start:4410 stop:4613 length:204 start_codon:yes stop_codon:yes gene_type:complete